MNESAHSTAKRLLMEQDPNAPQFDVMSQDELQNFLLLIVHHLADAKGAIQDGDTNYLNNSLNDISEVTAEIAKKHLNPEMAQAIAQAAQH